MKLKLFFMVTMSLVISLYPMRKFKKIKKVDPAIMADIAPHLTMFVGNNLYIQTVARHDNAHHIEYVALLSNKSILRATKIKNADLVDPYSCTCDSAEAVSLEYLSSGQKAFRTLEDTYTFMNHWVQSKTE